MSGEGDVDDAYDDNFDGNESDDDEFHTGSRMLFNTEERLDEA